MDSKRILVIGKPKSGKVTFVKVALTGSLPKGLKLASNGTSHAGLSHEYTLRNKYFQKEVGLWVDEYTDLKETLGAYASDEAKEVIDAIGAIVYTFRSYEPQEWSLWESFIQNLEKPIPMVGLHMDTESMMTPPDCPYLEYVAFYQTGKNEFGGKWSNLDIHERKKQAMSIINSLVNEGFQESDLD
ncbi:recombination protein Irc6 [Schizosaccharomyces octosporus yFS286]|uniref:Recombination protein Irc6 n=1 Tax=Schizosaccharomyces octosporus (strain yFS286) TaxID=483514 RepID=S9R9C8_SCHOY|nr:recombination protein Irc6 [Schizosaccharomyces octosporus yFS286]EPX70734.1 recombination protein Irc6 [Schizosaccharomyces octosporus yFS286]